jgi:hypothetical protein
MKLRMNSLTKYTVSLLLFSFCYTAAQEIPEGIIYKIAPDEINTLAKSGLEHALANSDNIPLELFGDLIVCGPMLWKSLKPIADQALLESKPILIGLSVPEPIDVEGKRLTTPKEQESFWLVMMARYSNFKKGIIRKAYVEEISYYWATIFFDIEEPFYVIDTDSDSFIVDFKVIDGKPQIFWIDLFGDLRTLKP